MMIIIIIIITTTTTTTTTTKLKKKIFLKGNKNIKWNIRNMKKKKINPEIWNKNRRQNWPFNCFCELTRN